MIDWMGLITNAIWILGLAVVAATLSYADWLAAFRSRAIRTRMRAVLDQPAFQLAVWLGLTLFCAGIALAGGQWWERALWGGLAAMSAVSVWRSARTLWLWTAGIVVGVAALAYAVRGVRWDDVWAAIRGAQVTLVLLALVTVLLTTVAKASRWRWLLYPEHGRFRLRDLLAALLVGQMLNTLVPARAGDLARAYHLGEQGQVSKATVLGSIVAEKAMDMVMLALCALLTLPWLYLVAWVEESALVLAVTAVVALVAVMALAWFGERLLEWLYPLLRRLPIGERLSKLGRSGVNGLQVFRSGRASTAAWLWSLVCYALAASTNYVLFAAMGVHVPAYVGLLLMVVLYLGVAPPSLPGKVGIFHGLTVLTLTTFGVPASQALAYGALLHLLIFVPPTLLGLLILIWRSPGADRLREAAQ